jgi:ribosomal protein L29
LSAIAEAIDAAQMEIHQIDTKLAEFKHYQQQLQQAQAASHGLQNPDLFSQYERHINIQIQDALTQLTEIQK